MFSGNWILTIMTSIYWDLTVCSHCAKCCIHTFFWVIGTALWRRDGEPCHQWLPELGVLGVCPSALGENLGVGVLSWLCGAKLAVENESDSHSVVSDSVTPWTVACQAPLSMEFSKRECWSGFPIPSPRDLPDPGVNHGSPALQANSLLAEWMGVGFLVKSVSQAFLLVFMWVFPRKCKSHSASFWVLSQREL